jgi:hypothetical protein
LLRFRKTVPGSNLIVPNELAIFSNPTHSRQPKAQTA